MPSLSLCVISPHAARSSQLDPACPWPKPCLPTPKIHATRWKNDRIHPPWAPQIHQVPSAPDGPTAVALGAPAPPICPQRGRPARPQNPIGINLHLGDNGGERPVERDEKGMYSTQLTTFYIHNYQLSSRDQARIMVIQFVVRQFPHGNKHRT